MPPKSLGEETLALQLRAFGIGGWVREYRFDPERRWRFDFAWEPKRFAVEVEGGTWIGGRHNRGVGYAKDLEKYNAASKSGWAVLRFTTEDVVSGKAIREIQKYLND